MNDLLNWIESEASRGLAEGDTVAALTAIKWKIKDAPTQETECCMGLAPAGECGCEMERMSRI
jgi:hypothetical protein